MTDEGTVLKGNAVKELNLEEVLRIAGGQPVPAALDEVTYRIPADPADDPADYVRWMLAERPPGETR